MIPKLSRRTALLAGLAIRTGSARAAEPVRVSSKLDAEAGLLGNIIRLALEGAGIPTVNRIQLGNTRITRAALLAGEIDIYPEYTGNGAFFFNIDTDPVWKDAKAGYQKVRQLDEQANKI
ncbi:MAG TPA: glycine betaine ABC transporter substrate-binding protein, partial [Acetobacteraceae bacterium]